MGNLSDGISTNHQNKVRNIRAYAEGVEHRMANTAINNPITDNPHSDTGSEEHISWDEGWNDADSGTVEEHVAGHGRTAP